MSNESGPSESQKEEFSLAFLWHKTPFKQKAAAIIIFVLSVSFALGLGFILADQGNRAPIVIEQRAD
jgi:hypothetical protein